MAPKKRDISRELFGKLLEEADRVFGPRVEQAIREALTVQTNGTNGDFVVGHEPTAYDILGVSPGDSVEMIRDVYIAKAKHLHPDSGGTSEKFVVLKAAYDEIMAERNKPPVTETVRREF